MSERRKIDSFRTSGQTTAFPILELVGSDIIDEGLDHNYFTSTEKFA